MLEELNLDFLYESYLNNSLNRLTFSPNPYNISVVIKDSIIDLIVKTNPSGKLPYHNAIHIASVVTCVQEAAHFYSKTDTPLSDQETVELLLAAVFHDYGYDLNSTSDHENILIAQKAVRDNEAMLKNELGDVFDVEKICSLIEITEYPHTRQPVTLSERILRDADYMMPYLINIPNVSFGTTLFIGLYKELHLKKPKMTLREFVEGVREFYHKVKWHTSWAQQKDSNNYFFKSVNVLLLDLVNKYAKAYVGM